MATTAFLPDGYVNSDPSDDELEIFYGNEDWNQNYQGRAAPVIYTPTPKEIFQRKCDDFYRNIVAGNLECVTEALKSMDVNIEFKDDWTPLLLAASVGNHKIVQIILEAGADVHKHKDFLNALMAACKCPDTTAPFESSYSCVKLLLDYGIDVNLKTRKRMTALMYAASIGNHLAVELLLPICDIHAVDNQGWHALYWAVNDKRVNIVRQLLAAGLNKDQVDVRKESLLNFALSVYVEEIILAIAPDRLNNNLCENYSDKIFSFFTDECTTLNEVTKKPNFYNDVTLLLHGSRSEQYLPQFMDNNTDLYSYLTATDQKLQEIGITTPFQRYRILQGLYKFHKSPYKSKSIPMIKAGAQATTIDISRIVLCFIRQLISMEASLQYLINHNIQIIGSNKESEDIISNVVVIREKLNALKKYCAQLDIMAEQWDKYNAPVDVINKNSIKKMKKKSIWYNVIPVCILIGCYFYIKKRI